MDKIRSHVLQFLPSEKKNGTSFILPKAEEDLLTHEICSVNESDDEELSHCITRVFP